MAKIQRITQTARRTLELAQELAETMYDNKIRIGHVLLALFQTERSINATVLLSLRFKEEPLMQALAPTSVRPFAMTTLDRATQKAWKHSEKEAHKSGQERISTEHLLLGILQVNDRVTQSMLDIAGISADQIRDAVSTLPSEARSEE